MKKKKNNDYTFEKDAKLLMQMLHEVSYCCEECERDKKAKNNKRKDLKNE